jgi:hypothetical protein
LKSNDVNQCPLLSSETMGACSGALACQETVSGKMVGDAGKDKAGLLVGAWRMRDMGGVVTRSNGAA